MAQKVSHYQESLLNMLKTFSEVQFFVNFDYNMSTTIYNTSVLEILFVTKFVTSSLAVSEAAIRVKSMYMIKSSLKTRKRKYGNKRIFFKHKCSSKRWFRNGIILKRADARESADVIYHYAMHIASLRVRHSYRRHKVGHAENT